MYTLDMIYKKSYKLCNCNLSVKREGIKPHGADEVDVCRLRQEFKCVIKKVFICYVFLFTCEYMISLLLVTQRPACLEST